MLTYLYIFSLNITLCYSRLQKWFCLRWQNFARSSHGVSWYRCMGLHRNLLLVEGILLEVAWGLFWDDPKVIFAWCFFFFTLLVGHRFDRGTEVLLKVDLLGAAKQWCNMVGNFTECIRNLLCAYKKRRFLVIWIYLPS